MELRAETSSRTDLSWSAIFAGTFVFLAIEATFATLAAAIFPAAPVDRALSAGPGIWMIVLSVIALYFGAKTAGHLSGEARKLSGMYYGLVTFGLSIFSTVLIATMFAGNMTNAASTTLGLISANAVWLFISLILGGIAAGIGGVLGIAEKAQAPAADEHAALRRVA
jgi:hypothetical protein